jgi:(+)-trans-carveol dehydrogenase
MSTSEDLAQTVEEVGALDRRIIATQADVRDFNALKKGLDDGVIHLGKLDVVRANAGIASFGRMDEMPERTWQDMIDTNLTGTWHTAKAAIPHPKAGGRGGSIILTSSSAGINAMENIEHYVSAKHGLVGLMRTLALELTPDMIREDSVHPTSVNTDMIHDGATSELFAPDLEAKVRTKEQLTERFQAINALRSRGWGRSIFPKRCCG